MNPHPLRAALALTTALAASLALVSCASEGLDLQEWPEPPEPSLALPNGSTLIPATADAGEDVLPKDSGEPFGSLRPNRSPDTGEEVSPNRRVPEIIERGRLVVGVAQSLNRLGFRDPVTKNMAGFEVDLAHEIARDIFGDPDRVEFRFVEGTGRENALAEGTVDLVLRTMTVTRDRQTEVEFSVPYLTTYPRILVMRNSGIHSEADLTDRSVCVTVDSTNLLELRRLDSHGDILTTQTWSDCLLAMQRQQVDAIFSDSWRSSPGCSRRTRTPRLSGPRPTPPSTRWPPRFPSNATRPHWCARSTPPWNGSAPTGRGTGSTSSGCRTTSATAARRT